MKHTFLLTMGMTLLAGCSLLFGQEHETSSKDCNSLAPLRETFKSEQLSSAWQTWDQTLNGGYLHEIGAGILSVEPGASGSRELRSRFEHNVRDSKLSVVIDQVHNSMHTYVELRALHQDRGGPRAGIRHSNGTLYVEYLNNTALEYPYDPLKHRVWQLRVTDDVLFFEAGPDSDHLEELNQTSNFINFPLEHVYAVIGVDGAGADGQVRIGGINATAAPNTLCKVSALTDSFNEDQLDVLWSNREVTDTCGYTIAGKAIEISSQGTNCSMRSGQGYDLRDGTIELQFDGVPQVAANGTIYFGVSTGDDENSITMRSEGSMLTLHVCEQGECRSLDGKPVGAETLWKLSVEEQLLVWSIREPGGLDQMVDKFPSPFPLEAMRVLFGANGSEGNVFRFGGINAR